MSRSDRREDTAMSTKIEDGGCAFPSDSMNGVDRYGNRMPFSPGMSLRDWFAGQALAGLIQGYAIAYGSPTNAPDEVVREAFNYADAMLAARSPARSA